MQHLIRLAKLTLILVFNRANVQAAHYFGMTVKHIPLDPKTFQVDIKQMEKAISSRTCMVSGLFLLLNDIFVIIFRN